MTELCSVCMLQSPKKLTPIFTKNGNQWQSTGLSEMLEAVLKEKIMKGHESKLAICTTCIYKISKLFQDHYSMHVTNISNCCADELSTSLTALTDELKWSKFRQTYCVFVDEEEANPKKKLKTTDEFKVPENKDYINCLPLECIAKIFIFFSLPKRLKMETVCQRWKDASEIAWGSIKEIVLDDDFLDDYYWDSSEDNKIAEQVLSRCGRYLEKLKVDCTDFDPSILLTANIYCQNLKKIAVIMPQYIEDNDFIHAFFGMRLLKEIHISYSSFQRDPLNLEPILSSVTPAIETIKIVYYEDEYPHQRVWIFHDYLQLAFWKFHALKCISLTGLNLNRNIMKLISMVDTLVELKLNYCEFSSNARLTQDLPNLETLKYTYNGDFNFPTLLSFINHCKNLKKLTLVSFMSEAVFNKLRTLNQLENFSLEYTDRDDNNIIGILAESCPNLKHLELHSNECYFKPVEYGFQNVVNLENLEHLTLREMEIMNDNHLSSIAMKCKKLKYLDLYGCTGISNSGLQKIGNFVNLEYLNLEGIEHVDDSVILSITSNCIKLKELNLRCLNNISDSALETLAQLKHLESLDIRRKNKIDNNVISRIVANCKKIQKIEYYKSQ